MRTCRASSTRRASTLADTAAEYEFGRRLGHTCMARLGFTPEVVLDAVSGHQDDADVLAELREHAIPPAAESWFDAEAVDDEPQAGVSLRVRPLETLPELEPRAGDRILAVDDGAARIFLGDRQVRVIRAGEVRIPPHPSHRIERAGEQELRTRRTANAASSHYLAPRSGHHFRCPPGSINHAPPQVRAKGLLRPGLVEIASAAKGTRRGRWQRRGRMFVRSERGREVETPQLDDDHRRRARLLILGKRAVLTHRLARPLAAALDDEQQS